MATESKAGIATTQVYEVYIKASPQAIWDAITSPEWTVKYGYQPLEYRTASRREAVADLEVLGEAEVSIGQPKDAIIPPARSVWNGRPGRRDGRPRK